MSRKRKRVLGRLGVLLLGHLLEDALSSSGMGNGASLSGLVAQALPPGRVRATVAVDFNPEDIQVFILLPARPRDLVSQLREQGLPRPQAVDMVDAAVVRFIDEALIEPEIDADGGIVLTQFGEVIMDEVEDLTARGFAAEEDALADVIN